MMNSIVHVIFLSATLSGIINEAYAENFGHYIGSVQAEWLDNGRDMRLLEPFSYVDPSGGEWLAEAGVIVDGASIPQIAWSLVGGPFEGSYREASVIHDVACVKKNRSWQQSHMTFYTAMRASGVSSTKAKIMFAAVYHFGPRWPEIHILRNIKPELVQRELEKVEKTSPRDSTPKVIKFKDRDASGNPSTSLKVVLTPKASTLNGDEFDELKNAIEQHDISLEEITEFQPH